MPASIAALIAVPPPPPFTAAFILIIAAAAAVRAAQELADLNRLVCDQLKGQLQYNQYVYTRTDKWWYRSAPELAAMTIDWQSRWVCLFSFCL